MFFETMKARLRGPAGKRLALAALGCVILLGLTSAVVKASAYLSEQKTYVEVAGDRTAYVPRDAQFVKYHGQVRRITTWAAAPASDPKDCKCPHCCDGTCYIWIYSDNLPDDQATFAGASANASALGEARKTSAIILVIIFVNC